MATNWFLTLNSETVDSIEQALKNDVTLAKKLGWNSQTLLHKAVLSCHIDVVRLLLKYGSDPNAVDGSGRTPVHYACLKARLDALVILIQFSGDITVLDLAAQSCVHLAAMSGSVLILHYLHTVHNQPLDTKDKNSITALHIACNQGHLDALRYLLRDNRCNINRLDAWGNSPLHLAAHNGSESACWEIVSHSLDGTKLLAVEDKSKRKPCDFLRNSNIIRQKELFKWLERWQNYYESTGCQIPPPNLYWYGSLLLPPVWFLMTLIICQLLSFIPHGFLAIPSFLCLAAIILKKTHRISHPSKYPEPVFAGLFVSGFISTALCYLFNTHGYMYTSLPASIISITAIVGTFHFMLIVFLSNPGQISKRNFPSFKSNKKFFFRNILMGHCPFNLNFQALQKVFDKNLSILPTPDYTVADVALGYSKEYTFCENCEIVKPGRVRHCKLCEGCCWRMDHHCLFLMKCIAGLNHRSFVFLLTFVLFGNVMFLISTLSYWYQVHGTLYLALQHSWCCDLWTISMVIGNVLCICWDGSMLIYQIDLVSSSSTTIFKVKNKGAKYRHRNMKERLANVLYFLKHGTIRIVDQDDVFNL